jgi:hypothetical protein
VTEFSVIWLWGNHLLTRIVQELFSAILNSTTEVTPMTAITNHQKLKAIAKFISERLRDQTLTQPQALACLDAGIAFKRQQGYDDPAILHQQLFAGRGFEEGVLKQQYHLTRQAFLKLCPEREAELDLFLDQWQERTGGGPSIRGR